MGSSEARDGNSEGGAADVVEADGVAELDGAWVAAVFTADAALEIFAGLAAELDSQLDQLTDAAGVERLERVALEDFLLHIFGKKAAGVVAAVTEGHLRQVVGAEAEELGGVGQFIGGDG